MGSFTSNMVLKLLICDLLTVFSPRNMDNFVFSPSIGALGGLLTVWNNSLFDGSIVQANSYANTVKLLYRLDNKYIHITNVYGPSNPT